MSLRLLPFKRALAPRIIPVTRTTIYRRTYAAPSKYSEEGKHPNQQYDAQVDRNKIDRQSNEYAKSGTDDAASLDKAFDPNSSNDPEEARKEFGSGTEGNPLDASPANPELSSGTSEVSGGCG